MQGGIWGKYAELYRQGKNLVLLNLDVAKVFPDDKAVNDALRLLIAIAQRQHLPTVKQQLEEQDR
ncbi:hypothetical protein [Leptolyngbya ohadii]|uniref:hypothetical protein n=1 Tax=Leptolyngbya ohadii TaxID=1962290 RepID=UPI001CED2E6D|nr:hypothetical protein [Leptolyngbya ohadii]